MFVIAAAVLAGCAPSAPAKPSPEAPSEPDFSLEVDPALWGQSAPGLTFDLTNKDGYTVSSESSDVVVSASSDVANSKPGRAAVTAEISYTAYITNTTAGRTTLPFSGDLQPVYNDPTICELAGVDGKIGAQTSICNPGVGKTTVDGDIDPLAAGASTSLTANEELVFDVEESMASRLVAALEAPVGTIVVTSSIITAYTADCKTTIGPVLWSSVPIDGCTNVLEPSNAAAPTGPSPTRISSLLSKISDATKICPLGKPGDADPDLADLTYRGGFSETDSGGEYSCVSDVIHFDISTYDSSAAESLLLEFDDSTFSTPVPFLGGEAMVWEFGDEDGGYFGVWSKDGLLVTVAEYDDDRSIEEFVPWASAVFTRVLPG
jgi:hypothetical protein